MLILTLLILVSNEFKDSILRLYILRLYMLKLDSLLIYKKKEDHKQIHQK